MKTRVLVAAIALPLLLIIVLVLPPVATAILFAAACGVAAYELLFRAGFVKHLRILIYTIVCAVFMCAMCWLRFPKGWTQLGLLLYCGLLFMELLLSKGKLKFRSICVAIFAGVVIPWLLGAVIRMRMDLGKSVMLLAFVLSMVPDTAAYFVGRALGKHKLCPTISPNKTVEGALGGVAASVIVMLLYGLAMQLILKYQINYLLVVVYAILGSGASMLGDLTFSVIKRQTELKDFGNILPGHGGILDRFDSTILVAPVVEALFLLLPFAVKVVE